MIRHRLATVIGSSLLCIHLLLGALVAIKAPFPTKVDERDHYSYARHIAETGQLWPDLRQVRLVDVNDVRRWGDETTQLSHPPVYYMALAPLTGDAARFPLASVTRMRLASVVVSALAVVVALAFAMRAFDDPFERVVFAGLVTLCPIANVMAGMINNDNLAFLAGSIVFLGLIDAAKGGASLRAAALIALGLAVAGLTKLTVLLGVGLAVAVFHVLPSAAVWPWRNGGWSYTAVIALGASIGTAPYLTNLAVYGSWLYVHPNFQIADSSATPLSLPAFFVVAMDRFAMSWPGFPPVDVIERWTLPAVVALALLGALTSTRVVSSRAEPGRVAAIGVAAVVAALALFTINVVYVFRRRGGVGGDLDVYFRFFLPLWPGLSAAVVLAAREFGGRWRVAVGVALFVLLIYGSIGQLALAALS